MRNILIAAALMTGVALSAQAAGAPPLPPASLPFCSDAGYRADRVAFTGRDTPACCDDAAPACAQYLSTMVIQKPKPDLRT
ncbi:MAG: hypothetical protein JOY71_13510 [Acetobacteraceae bacterium]|nr:hypothetical protein [Acetobacteraceae bacterium]MBV8589558.1 hypothetical protein [Acetobacteraceae bacterium]